MDGLSTAYLYRAELWLCISTLVYFMMNGAQIFETLVFVPRWTESPPERFKLLLDGRGMSLKSFWIVLHSVHEVTFILAIIFCWDIHPIRNWLLILFAAHVGVRVWTLAYFAPNIIEFQKIAETSSMAENLVDRTSLWQRLNYVRVAIFLAISAGLIPLCIMLLAMCR